MSDLDTLGQEITALEIELVRLSGEYDLDDGIDDEAERADLDNLQAILDEAKMKHSALSNLGGAASTGALLAGAEAAGETSTKTDTTATDLVSYYDEECEQFFGTRMSNWASRSSQAILGARTELNVPVPDKGFTASNLVDVFKLIPVVGQYAGVAKDIYGILEAGVNQINLSGGISFADVGNELSRMLINFQSDFTSSSTKRKNAYNEFVKCFRGNDAGEMVSKAALRKAIEGYAASFPSRGAVAKEFLMTCLRTVEDPTIEFRPIKGEPAGFEAGYVNLYFSVSLFSDEIYLTGAYMDDTPTNLVKALSREFGPQASVTELPVKIRCEISVPYMDFDDEDEDDSKFEFIRTEFLALRNSETPGNKSFTLSGLQTKDRGGEMAQKYSKLFLAGKYAERVAIGTLKGE